MEFSKKPNILLIMTDQQRFDTLRCYGNEIIETPCLNWLAEEGTVFTKAYTPSPSCVPARASLITGKKPWKTGVLGMGGNQLEMGVNLGDTIPEYLSKLNYFTAGIGKMHFYPQRALNGFHQTILDESGRIKDPDFISDYKEWFDNNKPAEVGIIDHGIDWNGWGARPYHLPEYLHATNWTVNQGIKFLKKRDPSKPFFLKLSFARPHSPYDPPEFYFNMYADKELPKPVIGEWVEECEQKVTTLDAWNRKLTDEELKKAKAGYYGSITHIDTQIGRFLFALKREKFLDDTLIIFTSDHGDMLGDHNLLRKTYAFEGSAHIPMLVVLPKNMRNSVKSKKVNVPVQLQDIFPTILDILGENIPNEIDGKSMFKLIKGEEIERKYIHGEHSTCYSENHEMQYIVSEDFKYIWYPRREKNEEQLFDLKNDPYELKDLSKNDDYKSIIEKMRGYMAEELSERGEEVVKEGKLVSQKGKPYMTSPFYEKRLESYGWDWTKYGNFKKGTLETIK
ncbi:arylsulfatase [Fusobacterium varium]